MAYKFYKILTKNGSFHVLEEVTSWWRAPRWYLHRDDRTNSKDADGVKLEKNFVTGLLDEKEGTMIRFDKIVSASQFKDKVIYYYHKRRIPKIGQRHTALVVSIEGLHRRE